MNALADRDFCAALVLALGHFLWQGALIASGAAICCRWLKSPHARYNVLVVAMTLMAFSPFATLAVHNQRFDFRESSPIARESTPQPTSPGVEAGPSVAPFDSTSAPVESLSVDRSPNLSAAPLPPGVATAAAREVGWLRFAPLMMDVYLLGVAVMLLRLMVGLRGGWQLRRSSRPVTDFALLQSLRIQAHTLGMKFVPILAYCERVSVPTVLGVLRPTILLPLAFTSGLTPDQAAAVLAHELAHLRRFDHVVNLLQRVVESLLFFHPAVWWVSNRIRVEREQCCDDLVVASGTAPLDYAKSLLRVAELGRASTINHSVAAVSLLATGHPSRLRQRISRLLADNTDSHVRLQHRWPAVALGILSLLVAWSTTRVGGSVSADSTAGIISGREATGAPADNDSNVIPEGAEKHRGIIEPAQAPAPNGKSFDKNVTSQETTPVNPNLKTAQTLTGPAQLASIDESDAKVLDEPLPATLEERIEKAIQVSARRRLTVGVHSPWQIMKGLEAFGREWDMLSGQRDPMLIRIDGWVASGPTFNGEAVWQITKAGVQAHQFSRKFAFESHPGQFLACLAAANVPLDFALRAQSADETGSMQQRTVRDILNDLKSRLHHGGELSWALSAIAHYESIDVEWKDQEGATWTIARLVQAELDKSFADAPVGGTHRLLALAFARNKYRVSAKQEDPLPDAWHKVDDRLAYYIKETKSCQSPDGSFSAQYFKAPGLAKDLNERLLTTGSQLAWLVIALPPERLTEEWITRAADRLSRDLIEHRTEPTDVGAFCAAVHALRLYRDRTRGADAGNISPVQPAITRIPQKGLEFLAPYPKLSGFSLSMTEKEFLKIAEREKLRYRKRGNGGASATYAVATGDNHTVLVMFKGEECSGIQRIRGEDMLQPAEGDEKQASNDLQNNVNSTSLDAAAQAQLERIFQQAKRSLVAVHTERPEPGGQPRVRGVAAGVIIDARGYVLTTNSIFKNVDPQSTDVVFEGRQSYPAELISEDNSLGLAVVRISAADKLVVSKLGTSSRLQIGDPVVSPSIGFDGKKERVTTLNASRGVINALHRDVQLNSSEKYANLIQTDAHIFPGGGPLLNATGEVIGIVVAIRAGKSRVAFATEIDDARPFLEKAIPAAK